MVLIPAGGFWMGTPVEEGGYVKAEQPVHRVRLTRSFWMGVYEVTQEQYRAVMGQNPSQSKGAKRPVENVSWADAQEFCKRVSEKTGETARLPTEAEWEYACRAGTTTAYCFGDSISTDLANYDRSEADEDDDLVPLGESRQRTMPVGSFPANPWGLHDMHGNVSEWCQDWFAREYYPKSPDADPMGPETGKYRVIRGGALHSAPRFCRSGFRGAVPPDSRHKSAGFRVVVESHGEQ
jgi:formylglycine-generating enzyme required for sulfatase activity